MFHASYNRKTRLVIFLMIITATHDRIFVILSLSFTFFSLSLPLIIKTSILSCVKLYNYPNLFFSSLPS